MNEETHSVLELPNDAAEALLKRSMRNTLITGVIGSLAVWIGSDWRNAAMLMTGMLISTASIMEWQRLARIIRAKLDNQKTPRSTAAVVVFFVIRLTVFGGVVYGSLKCFKGSPVALLFGLGLAALAIMWEAVRLLLN